MSKKEIKLYNPIICPSCKKSNEYQIAIGHKRLILDCSCTYRLSLPFDSKELDKPAYKTMPLEFNGTIKVQN